MKKIGFTLTEVILTLMVIGVIASLTMPALMANVEKHKNITGLQTAQNIFNNGFAQYLALNNEKLLQDTKLWTECMGDSSSEGAEGESKKCVERNLKGIFSLTSNEVPSTLKLYCIGGMECTPEISSIPRYKMSNGMMVYMNLFNGHSLTRKQCDEAKEEGGSMCGQAGQIYVDVNGDKYPNTFGKDIFGFALGTDGKLYAYGSKDVHLYDNRFKEWKDTCDGKPVAASCTADAAFDLTGRVIDEGYQIKYY